MTTPPITTSSGHEAPAPPPATLTPAAARAAEGRSFMRIALDRFLRNRLAVAALVVVWLLVTIAVFVPLITNDKPYAIVTTFPARYDNSYFVVLSAGDALKAAEAALAADEAAATQPDAAAPETAPPADLADDSSITPTVAAPTAPPTDPAARRREAIRQMRYHLGEVRYQLPADKQARLDALAAIFEESFDQFEPAAFSQALLAFEEEFDIEAVTLVARRYYPLFRALSWQEAAFMAFYGMAMAYLVARVIRRRGTAPRPLRALAVMAALALLCGGLWHHYNPPYNDTTNYKRLVQDDPSLRASFPLLPYGENENVTQDASAPPWWLLQPGERALYAGRHWLGADTNGRDVLCRMVFGARIAMSIGLVAVGIYIAIGIVMGALAGYYRGWIDMAISRLIEIVICFPSFFLIIAVLAFLRPSIFNIMVVIGLTGWTGVARLVRGEFLRVVNEEYVTAIRALGGGDARIIFRHVLPNGMGPLLVSASFGLAAAILAESALSFLGFGVPQPNASWGTLLYDGRNDIVGTWWLTVFPGLAIFLTVTALNLVGEGIRDATDPRFFAD